MPNDRDLTHTDPTMDLGKRTLAMLAEGYDGEQIRTRLGCTAEQAESALHAYATRILRRAAPATQPSPECRITYDGWCFAHGVFHPEPLHFAGGGTPS